MNDALLRAAIAEVRRSGIANTSFIHRSLQLPYVEAAKLMAAMEAQGVITHQNHLGKREVIPVPAKPNPILKFFDYSHLPVDLQKVSRAFAELAQDMNNDLPDGPEKSAGLRKLLEAKDCMVRAKAF